MAKREAEPAEGNVAKKARTGDDPLEVRRALFKAKGLMAADYTGPAAWTLVAPGHGAYAEAQPLELQYFALRALGQLPQLCLEVAGYPYIYSVMLIPHFTEHVKSKLAFGRLPCVKTLGGLEVVQSKAVLRYVAKVCGLAGASEDEVAACDMLHEMLLTDAKVDDIQKLAGSGKKIGDALNAKDVSRGKQAEMGETQLLLLAVKHWDATLGKAKAAGHDWLLAGLEGFKLSKLCYVDLVLFCNLRSHVPLLEELGCDNLVSFVKKVGALEGFVRFVDSGRMMPEIGQPGYMYKEDDLVKQA